ncbi:MAG: hypothetical protein M3Q68_02145 [Actinomycetota bacterium]|nr:hypothetical protein [Actinomycetota bacterium]
MIETDSVASYSDSYPKGYWVGLVVGWFVIAVGLRGLLINADSPMATNPPGWALLLVQSNLAHDFVLLPIVFLVGRIVARVTPRAIRAPVQVGLICSGAVLLFAYPFVRGFGVKPSNPTILPQDEAQGLLVVLAAVWVGIAVATVARRGIKNSQRRAT